MLYTTVNVTVDPDLKVELLAGRLNRVTCPECGRQQRLETELLYHDMDRRIAIWVFPEARKSQATEIKKDAEDEATRMKALLSRLLSESGESRGAGQMTSEYMDYLASPHIVFGLDELAQLVAQLEGDNC